MTDLFMNYLQGGRIQVAFLGAAQIDRFGNINTTVIGDYHNPKVRLPGSGGACEIAIHAKKVFVIVRLSKRTWISGPVPDSWMVKKVKDWRTPCPARDRN